MPVYKRQIVSAVAAAQKPQVAPLTGHELAKRSRVAAVMQAQDKTAALSRRVIATQSLHGAHGWSVPDTDPLVASGSQTHPIADEVRAVARARADVTPGCFLRLRVAYIPSGESQIETNPLTAYAPGGNQATIQLDVTWTDQDGNTLATTHSAPLIGSTDLFAAASGAPWSAIKVAGIGLVAPDDIAGVADLATWTRHVHAEITMSHVGGARVIDAVVEEVPHELAREADDAADLWTSHMFAGTTPDGPQPDLEFPWQRFSEVTPDGDPRGGGRHLLDVANAQRTRLGPSLFSWTAFNEDAAVVSDTDIPEVSTTSTPFVRVPDEVTTDYDADGPGWTLANHARGYGGNHPCWATGNGSIPVLVAVYGSNTDLGAVGRLRLQSAPYSWVDVDMDARDPQWWYAYGHLRCGTGPGDPSVTQALMRRVSGTGSVAVQAINVYAMRNYPAVWG